MDFILTVKDYLVREARVEGRKDIYENENDISHVRFNVDVCRYTFKLNGETVYYNVPRWKTTTVDDRYEVSRHGQVRRKGKLKYLAFSRSPYCRVLFSKHKLFSVHKLVVETFIGRDINTLRNEVNHNDLDIENNNLFNLHWVTRKENIEHYLTITNKYYDYEGSIGKELHSKDGKIKVVGYDKEKYKLIIEFDNTGNQKYISPSTLTDSRPTDNFYIVVSPSGEIFETRSLNFLYKTKGIQGARFSEVLLGYTKDYKGWTVYRSFDNKII